MDSSPSDSEEIFEQPEPVANSPIQSVLPTTSFDNTPSDVPADIPAVSQSQTEFDDDISITSNADDNITHHVNNHFVPCNNDFHDYDDILSH